MWRIVGGQYRHRGGWTVAASAAAVASPYDGSRLFSSTQPCREGSDLGSSGDHSQQQRRVAGGGTGGSSPSRSERRRRGRSRPVGKLQRRKRSGAAGSALGPFTAPSTDFYDSTAVPGSLDVDAQADLVDVEKFFPAAIAHLKAHPSTPDVAADKEARRWHDITHTLNVDGFRPPEKGSVEDEEAKERSFFDEGSLDIRGGLRDAYRASASATAAGRGAPPPPTYEESLSPDILQLTGGRARKHGAALANKSNTAPADQTLEPEDGNYMGKGGDEKGEFGDTPVQLTDMLRERLMELKGEKLREERNDTYMPRRLQLKSDAQLTAERGASLARDGSQASVSHLLELATAADHRNAPLMAPSRKLSKTSSTTLADLAWEDGEAGQSEDAASAAVPAIQRDGVSRAQQALAADVLRGSVRAGRDAVAELDHLLGRTDGPDEYGGDAVRDGVYLLRVLPRASLCSRREAAAMIASGQVKVNNVVERNPFRLVRPEDDVHIAGHRSRLRFSPPRLWMYHKPANVIVSRNDVAGRTLIGKHARILGMDHLIPVGSLPMRAHGILLLTNDGELSRYLENPKANLQQTYLLRVRPAVDAVLAHKLNTEGININGRQYKGAMEFYVNPAAKSRYSLKVKVRGETMPISRLMQHLGRKIERGGRMSFGPFSLSTLPVGSVREVAVPPFYAEHLGSVWQPFVDRDWPYFRRQRVTRLRRLARYRELTPRELDELDNYTYDEMQDALRFSEQELATAAETHEAQAMAQRPSFFTGQAIPRDFPRPPRGAGTGDREDVNTLDAAVAWADTGFDDQDSDTIIEDVTNLV